MSESSAGNRTEEREGRHHRGSAQTRAPRRRVLASGPAVWALVHLDHRLLPLGLLWLPVLPTSEVSLLYLIRLLLEAPNPLRNPKERNARRNQMASRGSSTRSLDPMRRLLLLNSRSRG